MANEKLISQISTIQRALGMIEGVSYGMEQSAGQALADAVQMIEEAVKEITDGKYAIDTNENRALYLYKNVILPLSKK